MKLGIGMVYQHFQLVEPFTVTENITLGKEFTHRIPMGSDRKFPSIILNNKLASEVIKSLSEEYGLPINPDAMVEDLSVGLRQRVEILKQLYRDAELLILDEPTAVLTPSEVENLFKTMKMLKTAGKSLIFISHKLREPLAIADRIVVMRKGKIVGEIKPDEATEEILAEMVVGRKVLQQLDRKKFGKKEEIVLNVQNLSIYNPVTQDILVKNASFQVSKHQIVGIAGVQGNGQTELAEAIVGLRKITNGNINLIQEDGTSILLSDKTTLEILNSGVAVIPEDRSTQGLILDFQIDENVWLGFHGSDVSEINDSDKRDQESKFNDLMARMRSSLMIPINLMEKLAHTVVDQFEVMTVSIHSKLRNLSGGNQQKVLLGREFAKHPIFIIASQPTRGVDIGIMEKVHQELINKRNEGAAILLISSDLDEVLKLSDYILVMYEGKIAGSGGINELSVAQISRLMTTGRDKEIITPEVAN